MNVYLVIEEWRGKKRRIKVEDAKVIGAYSRESTALARADRLREAGVRQGLQNYVVRIEEHEVKDE